MKIVGKLTCTAVLGLICSLSLAQNVVKGRLLDAQTQEPEPGAVVQLFQGGTENENIKGYALSDSLGIFSIPLREVQAGTPYTVKVVNLGRKTIELPVSLQEGTVDLGTLLLEDDVQALKSSKVTAAKPLIKMEADKIAYDVESDVDSKASTVLDMLRKVPMVTVDGQDNITVNGSSSFKVYVDGKPNQMLSSNPSKVFKVMPASAVKGIEVITNPGARYDAEGTGGVLNLITAKAADGSSAVPDGANGSISYAMDTKGSLQGGLYLNAKKGKFTVGGNLYAGRENNKDISQTSVQHIDGGGEISTGADVPLQKTPFLFGDINASYELDTLNLFSASLGLRGWAYDQTADAWMKSLTGGVVQSSYDATNYANGGSDGLDASIDWQHSSARNKERMLTLSYRFSNDPEDSYSESIYSNLNNITLYNRKVVGSNVSQEHTFQGDYTTPIAKGQTISSGLKYIYRNNHSDDTYALDMGSGYVVQPVANQKYHHHNHIAAAYTEYGATFGKFSFKAGLRYEYTFLNVNFDDGTGYDGHYSNFVPNLSLQYNLGATSNLGATYNMRISRPGITYLNPFVDRSSTTTISYGNPDIEPEKTHSFALKYNFFSPKIMFNAGLNYRFGEGGIAGYQKYAPDPADASVNIVHSTYGNIVSTNALGANFFVNWNPLKDTRIYANCRGDYNTFESAVLGQENRGWHSFLMMGAQQTIWWDLRLSANLFAHTKHYSLQGWSDGFSGVALGVTKAFFEDKLNVSLRGFSNLKGGRYASFNNYTKGVGFTSDTQYSLPIRAVGIELTYNFGKNNFQVKKTARSITNDDVVNAENAVRQQSSQTSMQ